MTKIDIQIAKWKVAYPHICTVDNIDVKLRSVYETIHTYKLVFNPHIMDFDLLNYKNFPYGKKGNALKALATLICTWLDEVPTSVLSSFSAQPGGQIAGLKKRGFTFAGNGRGNSTIRKNGEDHRCCTGFDVGRNNSPYVQVSDAEFTKLKKGKRCPFTASSSRLQLDHRTPSATCNILGIPPAVLTQNGIDLGYWEDDFQMLSPVANTAKREACMKCEMGEDIIIPAVIHKPERFKQNRKDGDPNSCKGCVWYDYTEPLRP